MFGLKELKEKLTEAREAGSLNKDRIEEIESKLNALNFVTEHSLGHYFPRYESKRIKSLETKISALETKISDFCTILKLLNYQPEINQIKIAGSKEIQCAKTGRLSLVPVDFEEQKHQPASIKIGDIKQELKKEDAKEYTTYTTGKK